MPTVHEVVQEQRGIGFAQMCTVYARELVESAPCALTGKRDRLTAASQQDRTGCMCVGPRWCSGKALGS